MNKRILFSFLALWLISCPSISASQEGTRNITGSGINLYFMNDKVFGTANTNPLWAIYNCGSSISGEMDIKGKYYTFEYAYHQKSKQIITGNFGPLKMSMGKILKTNSGFLYEVLVDSKKHTFSIQYEKVQDGHMLNSIIKGNTVNNQPIHLKADGHLCPFATTGIIMITLGATYVAGN